MINSADFGSYTGLDGNYSSPVLSQIRIDSSVLIKSRVCRTNRLNMVCNRHIVRVCDM